MRNETKIILEIEHPKYYTDLEYFLKIACKEKIQLQNKTPWIFY